MNFKRKKKPKNKCMICAGQRRLFGDTDLMKKKLKEMDKEVKDIRLWAN